MIISSVKNKRKSYITILPRTITPAWPTRIKYVNNSNAQRRKKISDLFVVKKYGSSATN